MCFFPHVKLQISQSRGPETSNLPENNSTQLICTQQQISFFPSLRRLLPNVPLQTSTPPSPNTQRHKFEPTNPYTLFTPNPVFAPNFTAPISNAPWMRQVSVHNTFQNNNYRVHKAVRSVAAPVLNMHNSPLGQYCVPNMNHWRFLQHIPSIVHQDITTVNSVPPNAQAHIAQAHIAQAHVALCQTSPVFQPTYPYVSPTPLSWSGPQVSAPVPPIPEKAPLIRDLADAIASKKNDPFAKWKRDGMSGMVNSKTRLTRSCSAMTLN